MNKISLFIFLSIILFIACNRKDNSSIVSINNRQIQVNNKEYIIKGICYHPVPIGSDQRSFNNLSQDIQLMQQAHINTIRVYAPIDDIEILDKIHEAGLKLIIGFGYNQNGVFDILSGTYIDYIHKYKNHPAVLMWELGNEYNYHPEWFEGDLKNWYSTMNHAAKEIHKTDSKHLVTTAHGEIPDKLALSLSPAIDVWGMNIYRWDNPENLFNEWKVISEKPMYLSEAGTDSYMSIPKLNYKEGVNEKAQADATTKILNSVFTNQSICSGVTLFAFVDELWKAGNNEMLDPGGWAPNSSGVPYDGAPNEEYWGIVNIDRTPKKAYKIVQTIYSNLSKKE